MADRVLFTAANGAGREVIARALGADLTPRQLRVLLVVISETVLWSKLEAHIKLSRLADAAGITGKDPRDVEKRIAADLKALVSAGIIDYRPGAGHRLSVVAVRSTGVETDPLIPGSKPTPGTGSKSAPDGPPRGSKPTPYTRKDFQDSSTRGGAAAVSSDGSAYADNPGGLTEL